MPQYYIPCVNEQGENVCKSCSYSQGYKTCELCKTNCLGNMGCALSTKGIPCSDRRLQCAPDAAFCQNKTNRMGAENPLSLLKGNVVMCIPDNMTPGI